MEGYEHERRTKANSRENVTDDVDEVSGVVRQQVHACHHEAD